jgi:hypothetical protein
MITQSAPMLAPFFASHDDSTVHAICTAIVSLIMRETALVSSINGCNPSFFQLLLQCTLMKPRLVHDDDDDDGYLQQTRVFKNLYHMFP